MQPAIAESTDPQVTALQGQLSTLRQHLAQLKTEYTDEWWEVVQTKKQIENVEVQLAPLQQRASDMQISKLKERLNEATQREQELQAAFSVSGKRSSGKTKLRSTTK